MRRGIKAAVGATALAFAGAVGWAHYEDSLTMADREAGITLSSEDSTKVANVLNGCRSMNDGRTVFFDCGSAGTVSLVGMAGTHSYLTPSNPDALAQRAGVESVGSRWVVENKDIRLAPLGPGTGLPKGYGG